MAVVATALLSAAPRDAAAATGVDVRIGATVIEVQCTPEQRTRIRACAKAEETFSSAPYKAVHVERAAGSTAPASLTVTVDPGRSVLLRTLLY